MIARFIKENGAKLLAGSVLVFATCGNVLALETLTITDSVCGGCTVNLGPVANGNGISFAGTVGNWTIDVTATDAGTPALPVNMDLDITTAMTPEGLLSLNPGTIDVTFSETGYSGTALDVLHATDAGTQEFLQTTTDVSVAGHQQNALSFAAPSQATLGATPYNFSVANVGVNPATNPFGISISTVITPNIRSVHSATSNYQLEGTLAPEPRFYGVTGLGLAGLLAIGALRRRKQETAA